MIAYLLLFKIYLVTQMVKNTCKAEDLDLIPGSERCTGEGNGKPLQYSFLENAMDRDAWRATVHEWQRVGQD